MGRIVIIDGNQRSGTNLLLHLLDGHPELRVLPEETTLYSNFYKPKNAVHLREVCETRDFEKFKNLTKDWGFFRFYRKFAKNGLVSPPKGTFGRSYEFKFSMERFYERLRDVLAEIDPWTNGIICREILECFWEVWTGKKRDDSILIMKNHQAALWLADIIRENPDIRFIHMVRNPLDVVSSQKERYRREGRWGFKRALKEIDKYDIMKWNIRNNQESVLSLKYENLVQKKRASLMQVCDFLNITFKNEVFSALTIGGKPWHSNTSYNPDKFERINEKRYVLRYKQSLALSIKEYNTVLKRLAAHIKHWGYNIDCISTFQYALRKILSEIKAMKYIKKVRDSFIPKKKNYNPSLTIPSYLNRHEGRDFLILASGKYLKEQEKDIHEFIKRYNPIIIASNDLAWFTIPHYHSFYNRRRFCTFTHTVHKESRIILSPYFSKRLVKNSYKGEYEEAMFRLKDDRTFEIADGIISSTCRSSALLNIGISIVMGARNIYVAGLDGFVDVYNSYKGYVVDEPLSCTYEEMRDIQGHYIRLIQEYLKNKGRKPFCILTKTHFKDWHKDVSTFIK